MNECGWTDMEIEQAVEATWRTHGEQYTYLGVRMLCRRIAHDLKAQIARLENGNDADTLTAAYLQGYVEAQARFAKKEEAQW